MIITVYKDATAFALFFASVIAYASTPINQPNTEGKQTYNQCIGCHSFSYNRTGPKHCGLFGRTAGSLTDYEYSGAMRNSGIVWSVQTLDNFIKSPFTVIPGTKMGFVGIADQYKRQNLILYMQAQAASDQCKPL